MRVTLILLAALLFGCSQSNTGNWRKLDQGMTRAEVEQLLGPPSNVSATGGEVFLTYAVVDYTGWDGRRERYVRLVDGKVVAFGKMGDFQPTQTLDITTRQGR